MTHSSNFKTRKLSQKNKFISSTVHGSTNGLSLSRRMKHLG